VGWVVTSVVWLYLPRLTHIILLIIAYKRHNARLRGGIAHVGSVTKSPNSMKVAVLLWTDTKRRPPRL